MQVVPRRDSAILLEPSRNPSTHWSRFNCTFWWLGCIPTWATAWECSETQQPLSILWTLWQVFTLSMWRATGIGYKNEAQMHETVRCEPVAQLLRWVFMVGEVRWRWRRPGTTHSWYWNTIPSLIRLISYYPSHFTSSLHIISYQLRFSIYSGTSVWRTHWDYENFPLYRGVLYSEVKLYMK